jgi:hypothetical protein
MTYTPYTYLIGWSKLNTWYYGVRYKKDCTPDDLWVTYFTSSVQVKKFYKEYGEPDIIEVRRKFTNRGSAKLWEDTVLMRIPKDKRSHWLNGKFGTAFRGVLGEHKSPEHKAKLRAAKLGRKLPEEHKRKIRESCRFINVGRVPSDETRKLWSSQRKGRPTRGTKGLTPWNKGVKMSIERQNPICSCLICRVEIKNNVIKQHHNKHLKEN